MDVNPKSIPTTLNNALGPRFKMVNEALGRMANQQLAESDLTFSQVILLSVVEEHGGVCAQRDLEHELSIAHPTVTGLVKRLLAKGYVETYVNADDARVKMVQITSLGKQATDRGHDCQIAAEMLMMKGLSDTEIAALGHLLDTVIENLKES